MSNQRQYDAVVIGAGIGGLVCGCFLAKAGLKTLIVEKNANPGGYCTSFTRGGFFFDACLHSLGDLDPGSNMYRVLEELGLDKRLKFTRFDPQYVIISPDYKISFWNDLNRTIEEFQDNFPKEAKGIKEFFIQLKTPTLSSTHSLGTMTFGQLLKRYFRDEKLKAILSSPILGTNGLPASKIAALAATKEFREFVLGGGNYPQGGMQALADLFALRFKELGGKLLLSKLVTNIKVKNNIIDGIIVDANDVISSKYVVSDCDARQTFLSLIGEEVVGKGMVSTLSSLVPSLSMFILYLGLKEKVLTLPNGSISYLGNYDVESMYRKATKLDIDAIDFFLLRLLADKRSIIMHVNASFKDATYWQINKKRWMQILQEKLLKTFPDLTGKVTFEDAATPSTLYKWTLNYEGAAYGWAAIPSQFAIPGLSQNTPIENLYLTGHWTSLTGAVPGVSYLGRSTAGIILNRQRRLAGQKVNKKITFFG